MASERGVKVVHVSAAADEDGPAASWYRCKVWVHTSPHRQGGQGEEEPPFPCLADSDAASYRGPVLFQRDRSSSMSMVHRPSGTACTVAGKRLELQSVV